jgi:uncharacterized protein YndB with AHSA1/START domain
MPERQYETRIELSAPRNAVWKALTEGAEIERWFAPTARVVAPRAGERGSVRWTWGDRHDWPQRIDVFEPARRLVTRYESAVEDGKGGKRPLCVDFSLEGTGGHTTLRLVHSGFGPEADFDAELDGISRGWPVELESLRLYLERHAGTDRRLAWCVRDVDVPLDEAWERLCGPEGLGCGARIDALQPGEPFRIATKDGDVFAGEALCCQPRELAGVAKSHGDAFLRISVERCGSDQAWLWLATYGRPAHEVDAQEARFAALLERLFAGAGSASRA